MDAIKHIKLTESHAQSLLRHACAENEDLIVKVEELQAQIHELQTKINENNALIELLEGNSTNEINDISDSINVVNESEDVNENIEEEYDSGWSLSKKVFYIISVNEKYLLAGEIVDGIIENEPDAYPDEQAKRKLSISVYAALNAAYKNGKLSRKGSDKRFRYYIKTEKKEQL